MLIDETADDYNDGEAVRVFFMALVMSGGFCEVGLCGWRCGEGGGGGMGGRRIKNS